MSPSNWSYRAEGGANVVFSFIGDINSLLVGYVLRVRKSIVQIGDKDFATPTPHSPHPAFTALHSSLPPPGSAITNLSHGLAPLSISLSKPPETWLIGLTEILKKATTNHLPTTRTVAPQLSDILSIVVDACTLTTTLDTDPLSHISIEIKPKAIGTHTDAVRRGGACRFCIRAAAAALFESRIDIETTENDNTNYTLAAAQRISLYCPCKLYFSTNISDVHCVLTTLIQRPRNNLRIFIAGICVFGEGISLDQLEVTLAKHQWTITSLLDAVAAILISPQGAFVLNTLQKAQEIADEQVGGPIGAAEILEMIKSGDENETNKIYALRDYILAATAKDASIIIALAKKKIMPIPEEIAGIGAGAGAIPTINTSSEVCTKVNETSNSIMMAQHTITDSERGHRFPFHVPLSSDGMELFATISVIDWDAKPLSRVEKWARLAESDENIWIHQHGSAVAQLANKVCGFSTISTTL